jgi:hypothetical protein
MKNALPPPLGDIDSAAQDIPKDCVLIEGPRLMMIAKHIGISFGRVKHRGKDSSWISDGVIILKADLPKWEAYQNRNEDKT